MTSKFKSMLAVMITIAMLVTSIAGIVSSSTARAAENNVYVSITGNDTTGDGTIGNPYRTLYFASRKLSQGVRLVIGGGIYGFDDCLWITSSGSAENPIIIEPAADETVTVNGNGKYGSIIYVAGVSNVIIRNINFYNVACGSHITSSKNVTIEGCSFVNLPNIYNMTFTDSSYCTVQNNIFDTNGGNLLAEGNGDAVSGSGCTNMLIQNNYFTKNGHYSVVFSISAGGSISQNNIIRRNYINQQWGGGIGLIMGTLNTVIEDNLVKNSGVQCVSYPKAAMDIAASSTLIRNNLLLASKKGRIEYQPEFAFDGDLTTYWWSSETITSALAVDLGSIKTIDKVVIDWAPDYTTLGSLHHQYFENYQILVSTDGQIWETAKEITDGIGGNESISFSPVEARYIKMNGLIMGKVNGISSNNGCKINDMGIYNSTDMTTDIAKGKSAIASSVFGAFDPGLDLEAYPYNDYSQNCVDNRIYNNVIYGNGGAAVRISPRYSSIFTRNKLVNNIMYKNRANGYTTRGLSTIAISTAGALLDSKWASFPNDNVFSNNIIMHADNISQYPDSGIISYDDGKWSKTLSQVETDYPAFFYGNKEENPMFTNEYSEDFSIMPDSPAIDAGADLAKTTIASLTPATEVTVDDSLFFTDGFGIVPGDMVIVGQNSPDRIMNIDYTTSTLTLESPISYAAGDSVNLPYNGSSPDIGAIEYGNNSIFATVPNTMPPVNTLAPTPTPTVSPVPTPTPTLDPKEGTMKVYDFGTKNQGEGLFKFTLTEGPLDEYLGMVTDDWTLWKANNIYSDKGAPDSTITYKFQGTKVRLFGEKSSTCGFAGITILDESGNIYLPEQLIDCYRDSYVNIQIIYTSTELPYGIYSIHIRNTGLVNDSLPFMQYNKELQKMTPIIWTLNFTKIEVFDSTNIVTASPTPSPTATLTPTPTATPEITKTPTPSPVPTFSDVGPDLAEGWACEYIQSLASLGIINGYSDGTFKPENYITRSEFIKVLTVAFGVYDVNATVDNFSDVKPTDWFYAYVASGVNSELASPGGLGDGTFGSETNMSREQMVTFSTRALIKYRGYNYPDETATIGRLALFNDSDTISDYARSSVALCVYQGILSGYNEDGLTLFKPANNINRAEVAKVTDMVIKLEDLR